MEGERIVSFEVRGHSGYAQAGEDIVCAAVSSAVNLVNATVNEVLGLAAAVRIDPDNAWLSINDTGQYFLTCRIGQDTDTVQIPDTYAEMLINDGFELIGREKK